MTVDPQTQTIDIYQRSNLTRLQLLFWVGQQLRPEVPLFNAINIFTIPTAVDPSRFQKAFQTLLDHSDALRTVLEEKKGIPQQRVIEGGFSDPLDYFDFSQDADPQAAFQNWLQKRSVVSLNLKERLFDSALIKISEDRFVWYLNQHHIIADAASFFLAFELLAQFYESPLTEEVKTRTELYTFADYVSYERAYRNSPQYPKAAAYWDRKLTPHPKPILFFGQQPAKKSSQVQRISTDLGFERSQKIREIARKKEIFTVSEELSLFNIFAALFAAQLHTMSGSRRFGFLVPVHNRFSPVFKNTPGLLMEYCPFQVEVTANDSFMSLITKLKRETRETFTYYQYGSGLPLQDQAFDVIFNMYQVPDLQLSGVPVQVERIYPGHGSERLALHVNDCLSAGKFVLHFDFSCDVFSEAQREQTVDDFVQLIDTFLEDYTRGVSQMDLLQLGQISLSPHSIDPDRQAQPAAILTTGIPEREVAAPRDELESQLIQIWERVLGINPIGIGDNFFDLGGSSWLAVRLFAEIESVTGIPLPLSTLLEAATVEELAESLRRQQEPAPWSPLVVIQSSGTKQPFFCVHGAGGHILLFDKVARYIGPDQPFFAFQARGIEEGQEPFTCIEDMAAYYVKALREAQPEGPYLLGGYSFGGMVAFEMAQQLRAQNQKVALLVIIDVPAQSPHLKYLRQFASQLGGLLKMTSEEQVQHFLWLRNYAFRLRYFRRLKPADKIVYVRGRFGALGRKVVRANSSQKEALPAVVAPVYEDTDLEMLANKRIRRMFSVNERAYRAYIPRRYQGRAAIIRSMRGYTGDPDKDYSPDPTIGWNKVISGPIETYLVPGDHLEMIREPHVRLLAEHLRTCLDNAQRQLNSPGTKSI
jgi:thioesterase domain-containing protein